MVTTALRKTADRMTAATALAHGLPLVTLNGRDYRDVPGLELVDWVKPDGKAEAAPRTQPRTGRGNHVTP